MSAVHYSLGRRLLRNRPFMVGVFLLACVLVLVVLAHTALRSDPLSMAGPPFLTPGEDGFLLGTDMLGRDILVQLAHGAGVSLAVGLLAASFAIALGVSVGICGAFFGGALDAWCTRLTELFQTVPQLLLAIVLVAVLTPSVGSVVVAIGLTSWTQVARLVRPEVLRLSRADFVNASRISGLGRGRIILHDILPNVMPTVMVMAAIIVAMAILTESALSFLGLGDPNIVSWGSMIGAGRGVLRDAWYIAAFPGIAILATVLAFTLLGNGLSDALNRRLGHH